MSKLADIKTTKEGPAFIYTYVPLASNQMKADNVRVESTDVFAVNIPEKIIEEPTIAPTVMNIGGTELEMTDDELF